MQTNKKGYYITKSGRKLNLTADTNPKVQTRINQMLLLENVDIVILKIVMLKKREDATLKILIP